jgi:hypothetical protein
MPIWKTLEGSQHADRNQQLEYIKQGPVLSETGESVVNFGEISFAVIETYRLLPRG